MSSIGRRSSHTPVLTLISHSICRPNVRRTSLFSFLFGQDLSQVCLGHRRSFGAGSTVSSFRSPRIKSTPRYCNGPTICIITSVKSFSHLMNLSKISMKTCSNSYPARTINQFTVRFSSLNNLIHGEVALLVHQKSRKKLHQLCEKLKVGPS